MKFLFSPDLNLNQLLNALLQFVAGSPGVATEGRIWYDSTAKKVMWRNDTADINPLARANHSGTQAAATISDFDTQVRTSRLDQMVAPAGDLSINSHKLTNVSDGSGANDAVNYGQMQAIANGRTFKDAVRCASTANVAAITGLLTLDGVTVAAGDRVLLKNQTTGAENGIYVAAAGGWARAADADSTTPDAELKAGTTVQVAEGTTLADTTWTVTTNGPITVGTTATVWAQTGAGTTYTQGSGITITGATIAVDTAVVVRKYASDIGNGAATSITVTHNLGTKDITVSVRQNSDDALVECDVVATSTTQATFTFSVAPAASALRVVVHG